MKSKTTLYAGLAILTISLLIFIGSLGYVFAPFFLRESSGIGAIGGSLFGLILAFLLIVGIIVGAILTFVGFTKLRNNNKLR